jgi:GNAT superfamily N-acetyltransferase
MLDITFRIIESPDQLPPGADLEKLADFFHEKMKPYHDTRADVVRGLEYAFDPARGGFLVLAQQGEEIAGGLVMLDTHMGGYIPRNLLLFVAVEPSLRGRGLGRSLIERAAARCDGPIKLHVEPDNPAARLYQRVGFEPKYLEMRWSRK